MRLSFDPRRNTVDNSYLRQAIETPVEGDDSDDESFSMSSLLGFGENDLFEQFDQNEYLTSTRQGSLYKQQNLNEAGDNNKFIQYSEKYSEADEAISEDSDQGSNFDSPEILADESYTNVKFPEIKDNTYSPFNAQNEGLIKYNSSVKKRTNATKELLRKKRKSMANQKSVSKAKSLGAFPRINERKKPIVKSFVTSTSHQIIVNK